MVHHLLSTVVEQRLPVTRVLSEVVLAHPEQTSGLAEANVLALLHEYLHELLDSEAIGHSVLCDFFFCQ